MNYDLSAPFFTIYPNDSCLVNRLSVYNMTTRTTIIGSFMFFLGLINIIVHSLLLVTIVSNWKYMFSEDFVYKLIVNMNAMSILYSFVTFSAIFPCIVFGCVGYSNDLLQILTGSWRGMEYGVYWTLFFIALDRFFVFYWPSAGVYFKKFYTIIILWIIVFLFQPVLYFAGCPKMFDLQKFSPMPCRQCMIFGAAWDETVRTLIYNMPYPMFFIYALIIVKILAMRCKVYNIQESFKKSDKVLAVQFVILCGIQFILSNTENYLVDIEANNPSYWSLLRFSVPYDVLIINAVLLMTSNRTLRKAFLRTFCNPCRKIRVHNLAATQGSKLHTNPKNLQARPTIVMTTA